MTNVDLRIERTLIKWGNGFGIRLTKAEVEALGLHAGDPVRVDVEGAPPPNDLGHLPAFRDGAGTAGHDDELGASLNADH